MGVFNSDPYQRRGVGGRLILAIGIAIIAWFVYVNQSEENPVTGERQHVSFSPDQEIRLGLQSAPAISKEMGGEIPESDARTQKVQRIGNFLVGHTIANKSPWKFQFHLLADSQVVNAFALPGGQIFITLGLYDKLQTDDQLAGVLSHEMGHVIERHTAEQMATSQFGEALAVAFGTATSDQPLSSSYMVASVVNHMMQLKYSRQDELEADLWGLKLMTQAGYNPWAMIEVMKILKEASKGGQSVEIFQTHPNPDLRMKQIEDHLKKEERTS